MYWRLYERERADHSWTRSESDDLADQKAMHAGADRG
jgi:hypothetical protein